MSQQYAAQSHTPLLVRVCRNQTADRVPVWFMRQAGRYLPEYQTIRGTTTFLGLCKTPDLAVEVSLQPIRRFGMDAVIMFSDILVPVEAMGMALDFTEKGPVLVNPLRSAADINALTLPDPVAKTGFVMEILKRLRAELASTPDVALIGFAGAPWTLASYMLEGGSSKNYVNTKALMASDPQLMHTLLGKIAQTVTQYLNAQIAAGAQVVQLFDSWGGIVSASLYREFILPYHQQVIDGLNRQDTPVILYVNGSRGLLPLLQQSGADVISVDWLTELGEAREILGKHMPVQGNLDPTVLFAKPQAAVAQAQAILKAGGGQGHIFNLGHGILPQTPIETVEQVVQTVKQYQPQLAVV